MRTQTGAFVHGCNNIVNINKASFTWDDYIMPCARPFFTSTQMHRCCEYHHASSFIVLYWDTANMTSNMTSMYIWVSEPTCVAFGDPYIHRYHIETKLLWTCSHCAPIENNGTAGTGMHTTSDACIPTLVKDCPAQSMDVIAPYKRGQNIHIFFNSGFVA